MDDPWFIWTKGPGKVQVTPRNAKGWISLAIATTIGVAPLILLSLSGPPRWTLAPALLWPLAVTGIGLRLAWDRSEVVDLTTIGKDLKELREWRSGRRPRR